MGVRRTAPARPTGILTMPKHRKLAALLLVAASVVASPVVAQSDGRPAPLIVQEQGSFAVGGTVISNPGTFDPSKPTPAGQTYRGDHAYVFFQIPPDARKLPLVL